MKKISVSSCCCFVGFFFFTAGLLFLLPAPPAGARSPILEADGDPGMPIDSEASAAERPFSNPGLSYFGLDVGNYQEMVVPNKTQSGTTRMDVTLIDKAYPEPTIVVEVRQGGNLLGKDWYQSLPGALGLMKEEARGYTMVLSTPLVVLKEPVSEGDAWTSDVSATLSGVTVTVTLEARVGKRKLVNVPAGTFLAYPIAYSLVARGPGGEPSKQWTEWFAPYIGTVKSNGSKLALTAFGIEGGTLTLPPPVVARVMPASGVPGNAIVVTGYHFGGSPGQVKIGETAVVQVLSWSDSEIELVVPAGASSGPVLVVTPEWQSNDSILFQVDTPPEITGLSPATAHPGEQVTLQGKNFGVKKGKVTIGNLKAPVPSGGWGNDAIACKIPKKLGPGTYDVTVTTKFGTDLFPAGLTVTKP